MNEIMALFGKNLASNFLFVLTFADSRKPNVQKSLEATFPQIISNIQEKYEEWFIKVNNSAMLKKINLEDKIDVSSYTMGS